MATLIDRRLDGRNKSRATGNLSPAIRSPGQKVEREGVQEVVKPVIAAKVRMTLSLNCRVRNFWICFSRIWNCLICCEPS